MSNQAETAGNKAKTPPGTKRTIEKKVTLDVDVFVKIFSVVATIAGIGVGIWQFSEQQRNNNTMEFRRRTWEKQMETYTDLGTLVSDAVNQQDDSSALRSVFIRARTFRLARLTIYQDTTMEARMDDFIDAIQKKIEGKKDLLDDNPIYTRGYTLINHSARYLRAADNQLSK